MACAVAASTSVADDSTAVIGAGGLELVKSDQIVLESQDLYLSPSEVRVRFRFRNDERRPIETLVAFVVPDLTYADRRRRGIVTSDGIERAMEFAVTIDGDPVAIATEIRAFIENNDITRQLADRSIRPDARMLGGGQRARLPAEWADGGGLPLWRVSIRYYWKQVFQPGRTVEIAHRYRPLVGSEGVYPRALRLDDGYGSLAARYCLTAQRESEIQRLSDRGRARDGHEGLRGRFLDYTLSTGANWKGPIGRLSVLVDPQTENTIVAGCFAGLTQRGNGMLGVDRFSYMPREDIRLLFVTSDRD